MAGTAEKIILRRLGRAPPLAAGWVPSAIFDAEGRQVFESASLANHICRVTLPDQVRTWGKALTPYACFMMMWRYDPAYMAKSANQLAFKDIAALAASKPKPTVELLVAGPVPTIQEVFADHLAGCVDGPRLVPVSQLGADIGHDAVRPQKGMA